MCDFASLVVTKDRVLWSKRTDGHTDICKEHGLHEDGAKGPNVVKVELLPPNGEFWKPRAEWRFHVDQDLLPEWWDAKDGEARARVALEDLASARIFDERDGVVTDTAAMVRNARVVARESSRVEAWGSSSVVAWESSRVVARESSRVEAWGSSSVVARESSRVVAWGSSTITSYTATRYPLHDLAVLIDRSKAGKVTTRTAKKAR